MTLLAIVLCHTVRAQAAPPRPNLLLTQWPELEANLWPTDVNEDGITDIVAGGDTWGPPNDLVVAIGRGDGTFDAPRSTGAQMSPVTVSDFNADSHRDIVAALRDPDDTFRLFILAGRGDGTFAAPAAIASGQIRGFSPNGMTADFDGDGHRDLAVLANDDTVLRLYPGNGDLTFGTEVDLTTSFFPRQFIVSDLNGDGEPDLAVATQYGRAVDVFLNSGAWSFAYSSLPFDRAALGITARDMNGDGRQDLIVSSGDEHLISGRFSSGFVHVLIGHGDGTFDAPRTFPTLDGPILAVAGDYNGDGLTDIATGNLTVGWNDRCDGFANMWDSVSILPGIGGGDLGPAVTFALGNSYDEPTFLYQDALTALKTSDLNHDGRTDLIASRGAILLGGAPAANRPPVADAGGDRHNVPIGESFALFGRASDPDDDWLTWEWTDESGAVVGQYPMDCVGGPYFGEETFTLKVTDGRGGVSTDTVTYTFGSSLPNDWQAQDIGNPDAGGASSFDGTRHIVTGSGSDIWGTADEFQFAFISVAGDFDFVSRVAYVENVDRWTKAGLMVRESLEANARHGFVLATPTTEKGVAFQRRVTTGGPSVHTAGPAVAPPVWLRLVREGDTVIAFSRVAATDAWTEIGRQAYSGLPDFMYIGFAVTSHHDGEIAEAWFEDTRVQLDLPAGWTATDVGDVGAAGSTRFGEGEKWTISGAGADIWGTADAFQFASREVTGDFDFAADVMDVENVNQWTKAGLMMRESLDPGSRHAFILATPGPTKGVAFQRRLTTGGTSVHTAGPAIGPPVLLRLVRTGSVVSAYYSTQSGSWTLVGTQTFTSLPATVRVGFAVTSHVRGTLATATFDLASLSQ